MPSLPLDSLHLRADAEAWARDTLYSLNARKHQDDPETSTSSQVSSCSPLQADPAVEVKMLPFNHFLGFALLWAFATCKPRPAIRPHSTWNQVASNQKFTLEQVAVQRTRPWSYELRTAYLKYGVKPPAYIEQAIAYYKALEGNETTSVGAKSYFNDMEYLINATVGNLSFTLNLDTGSADLYFLPFILPVMEYILTKK
jgi:hypothetical protein